MQMVLLDQVLEEEQDSFNLRYHMLPHSCSQVKTNLILILMNDPQSLYRRASYHYLQYPLKPVTVGLALVSA